MHVLTADMIMEPTAEIVQADDARATPPTASSRIPQGESNPRLEPVASDETYDVGEARVTRYLYPAPPPPPLPVESIEGVDFQTGFRVPKPPLAVYVVAIALVTALCAWSILSLTTGGEPVVASNSPPTAPAAIATPTAPAATTSREVRDEKSVAPLPTSEPVAAPPTVVQAPKIAEQPEAATETERAVLARVGAGRMDPGRSFRPRRSSRRANRPSPS
jgi:hypothetical protein